MKKFFLLVLALSAAGLHAQTTTLKPPRTGSVASTPVTLSVSRVIDGSQSPSLRSDSGQQDRTIRLNLAQDTNVVEMNQEKGQAIVLEKKRPSSLRSLAVDTGFVREEVTRFLASSSGMFYLTNPLNIRINKVNVDNRGTLTGRGEQIFKGYPVYGADFTFNISSDTERFTGRTVEEGKIVASVATLDTEQAIQTIRKDLQEKTKVRTLTKAELKFVGGKQAKIDTLYYPTADGLYRLSYQISYRPNLAEEWIYFINATDGTIISHYNNTKGAWKKTTFTGEDLNGVRRAIHTAYDGENYYLYNLAEEMYDEEEETGAIIVYDANFSSGDNVQMEECISKTNEWTPLQVSTMWGITQVYHYYKNTFGRNSLDGEGGDIVGVINLNDEDGEGLDNAYWNGEYMAFGNGDKAFTPLAGSLDVIGHELTHGVVGATANLEYRDQSGAMNESFADIFGAMVDRDNWTMGETIIKSPESFPSGAMRDLSNPHNGGSSINDGHWQPAHTSEMYRGDYDEGGVHINSGILNFAYYKYATATSKEEAEQVYYHTLTHYLTRTSQFTDLRLAVIRSARELYGEESAALATKAFEEVGIWEDNALPLPTPLDPNPGDECLALNVKDPESGRFQLMTYNTVTQEYKLISEMPALATPSVTDNGKLLLYVGEDYKIYRCDLEKGTCTVYSEETPFAHVAISKDGTKVAAVPYSDNHPYIYVRYLDDTEWIAFKLANRGTEGVTHDVKYADHIVFDITGEGLLFDTYNETSLFSYWSIGFLNVWDPDTEDWCEDEVGLVSALGDGVDSGNPTVFNNSQNYMFEIISPDVHLIRVCSWEEGPLYDILISDDEQPVYPTVGIKDDHIALMLEDDDDLPRVIQLDLSDDNKSFILGEEDVIELLGEEVEATYPVYFGTGERALGKEPVCEFQTFNRSGEAPLTVTFDDHSLYDPTSWLWTFEGGMPATSDEENPTVVYEKPGSYDVTLTVSNSHGSSTLTKKDYIIVSDTPTSIEEIATTQLSVYPNPAVTYLVAEGVEEGPIAVYSLSGKMYADLAITWIDNQTARVDVSSLPKGLYILKCKNGSAKFTKQ